MSFRETGTVEGVGWEPSDTGLSTEVFATIKVKPSSIKGTRERQLEEAEKRLKYLQSLFIKEDNRGASRGIEVVIYPSAPEPKKKTRSRTK